eukprot:TRINITY_DN8830_c0_g1_i3.p1 TRINITY_DN8830_c0_g1~~TRINITY_DN8830_c0_g1_i3.p1  ORF type:complete len:349 (-),score=91.86 TRINITY_DN8830_c0_g1_i3:361-1407(-)
MCIRDRVSTQSTGTLGMCMHNLELLFSWQNTVLMATWKQMLGVTVLGVLAQLLCGGNLIGAEYEIPMIGHEFALFPVAYLLVFRNGESYRRYWEGRGFCGQFVGSCRNLARLANAHVVGDGEEVRTFRQNVARLLRVHAIAQRHSLRHCEDSTLEDVRPLLAPWECAEFERVQRNLCQLPMRWLAEEWLGVKRWVTNERVLDQADRLIQDLTEAWMGMHKLATTPMPFPLVQELLMLAWLWMITFPFAFASNYGWASPPFTFILAFGLFGLMAIGSELEDPFGVDPNDLPLEGFEAAAGQASSANGLDWAEDKHGHEEVVPSLEPGVIPQMHWRAKDLETFDVEATPV